jgi:hypothetical protein
LEFAVQLAVLKKYTHGRTGGVSFVCIPLIQFDLNPAAFHNLRLLTFLAKNLDELCVSHSISQAIEVRQSDAPVEAGLAALVGELFVADRAGAGESAAVLVGDVAGEGVGPGLELSFGFNVVQPRIKASHKQPATAPVKRCCLEFCIKFNLTYL